MNKKIRFDYKFTDALGAEHLGRDSFIQTGSLYALAPAIAVQIVPGLSVGGTLNIWGKGLFREGWRINHKWSETGMLPSGLKIRNDFEEQSRVDFSGINGNIGLLWNVYGPFTLGAVYKTPFLADLKRTSKTASIIWENGRYLNSEYHNWDIAYNMHIPASYGIGISYRHSDAWTVAFDLYRTEWSNFWITDDAGKKNALTGRFMSQGAPTDTTQVRLGTEYLFIKDKYVVPVRFGLFYDPEPAIKSPDDYYGFSLGTGYATERISFDIAYQFRAGKKVDSDIASAIPGSSASVTQHSVLVSLIYYFGK
jgi:long-subunit fatty acid transport protein